MLWAAFHKSIGSDTRAMVFCVDVTRPYWDCYRGRGRVRIRERVRVRIKSKNKGEGKGMLFHHPTQVT